MTDSYNSYGYDPIGPEAGAGFRDLPFCSHCGEETNSIAQDLCPDCQRQRDPEDSAEIGPDI